MRCLRDSHLVAFLAAFFFWGRLLAVAWLVGFICGSFVPGFIQTESDLQVLADGVLGHLSEVRV